MIHHYKRIILSLLFSFLFLSNSQGQRQKFVFVEGLGAGALVNFNFDMRFKPDAREGLGFRAGFGNSGIYLDEQIATLPLGVNYVLGKGRSSLLAGVNTVFTFLPTDHSSDYKFFMPSLEIGYRFRPMNKGFAFQVTYNPLFNSIDGFKPLWFGIGIGYAWR